MKPTFLVIGCGKCGTTSLCAMLGKHPDVFVCDPKEPNFLSHDRVYQNGWAWYESLFTSGGAASARGEGSVSYAMAEYEDRVIDRLLRHLPEVRLIYMVRHPIARLESVYREHHNRGHLQGWHLPFEIGQALAYRPAMLSNTRYWERIGAYRRHFGDDRILVLFLEDFQRDHAGVLSRCFEFLGVDSSIELAEMGQPLNPGGDKFFDTRPMRFIRTVPILGDLWRALPQGLASVLSRPLRRRFSEPIPWADDVRRSVLQRLGPDAKRFLAFYGKPATFWNLDP